MFAIRTIAFALALASSGSFAHAGNVLVVDATNPPGTYATIQAAIDVSTDGDAILVRSGAYTGFQLPDRELAVVADLGAVVTVSGAPRLVALAASRSVHLAGLQVTGANIGSLRSDGLILGNASGAVRIEDCTFAATPPPTTVYEGLCSQRHGAVLVSCADVAFTRCTLTGQTLPQSFWGKGGDGLLATSSNVALYDCTVRGGHGATAGDCAFIESEPNNCLYGYTFQNDGADGGAGCKLVGGALMISGGSVRGGDGSPFAYPALPVMFGGCGGDGVLATGVVSVWGLGAALAGGPGQSGLPQHSFHNGPPGDPVAPDPSVLTTLVGTPRTFHAPHVVREGQPIPIHLEGLPGDRAVVLLDLDPARVPSLPFRGWYLVHPPPGARFVRVGMLDATGALDRDLVAPTLAPGELSRTLFLQSIHVDTTGSSTLGPAQTVVVVDSSS